jgi:hypothetical protein
MDASNDIAHFTGNSRFDFGDMSVFGAPEVDLIHARKRSAKKQKLTRAVAICGMGYADACPEFTDVSEA